MSTDLRAAHYHEVLPALAGNRLRVFEALALIGACTPKELAKWMGWDKTSVRPRLTELVDLGRVQPTGERRNGEHEFAAVLQAAQTELILAQ